MSADATQNQQIPPLSSLSMAVPPIQNPNVSKQLPRVKPISQREPWPKVINLGMQPSPSSSLGFAGTTQLDSPKVQNLKAGSVGLQKSSSMNKRGRKGAEASPVTPKTAASESFETVRLKMRESLVAALELVVNEKKRTKDASQGDGILSEDKSCVDKMPDRKETEDARPEIGPLDNKSECPAEASMDLDAQKYDGVHEKSVAGEGTSDFNYNGLQECQKKGPSTDDGSHSVITLMKDDFLQENGLSWVSSVSNEEIEVKDHVSKRPKMPCDIVEESNNEKPQALAKEIEEELFKFFGGVNKKYKEKGRSLLFNLKDRHNPELRQRVFSGEISPGRLCSMTAEELASKELSQWRIAKAEELAQMVVLPESDVKYRMVKKTHKGEYQVEVEHDDPYSVEVAVGTSLLPQLPARSSGDPNKHSKVSQKYSEISSDITKSSSKKMASNNRRNSEEDHSMDLTDSVRPENSDLMQYLIGEESKDENSLPPVPSLDEFMMELDSEPPFVTMQDRAIPESSLSDDRSSDSFAKSTRDVVNSPDTESKATTEKSEFISENQTPGIVGSGMGSAISDFKPKPSEGTANDIFSASMTKLHSTSDNVMTSFDNNMSPIRDISNRHLVWDGLIQLNISSLVTALGFYQSGEKVSTREWPSFLEIKGRVRLDAFEKFLQELRLSRSRGIMVMQFCWKDGSPESGRMKLCETVDSYIVDERVGVAEPMPGLELYFCPPHPKTTEVLIGGLAKEHEEAISKVDDGLLGILIWKKEVVSPRPPSHSRKHSRKHSVSRNSKDNQNANVAPNPPVALNPPPPPTANEDEEIDDDVPPGFGPAAVSARRGGEDDDDLPEFSFSQHNLKTTSSSNLGRHPRSTRPVEHLREMIQKYGSNENKSSWKDDDDDDDIPEWRPDLPINPAQLQMPHQHTQSNHYPHQIANQFPVPTHSGRPMYPKTASQVPQHDQFAGQLQGGRGGGGGGGGRYGSGHPTRYPGPPGAGGRNPKRTGWNLAFPQSR